MELTLNMTMSLNGIAARDNDSTDIFQRGEWGMFVEMARQAGAIIWGRRTHEVVRGYGAEALNLFDGIGRVVVSHDPNFELEPGWQVATSPQAALALLEAAGHERALLGGGAKLNSSFAEAGLIDVFVMFVESVIVGKGVPVFAPELGDVRLDLIEVTQVDKDLAQLRYSARREG